MLRLLSLLVIGQLFLAPAETQMFTASSAQIGKDALIIVSYPSAGEYDQVCIELYVAHTEELAGRHCWKPRGAFDQDLWENWWIYDFDIYGTLWQLQDDGSYTRWDMIPVVREGK